VDIVSGRTQGARSTGRFFNTPGVAENSDVARDRRRSCEHARQRGHFDRTFFSDEAKDQDLQLLWAVGNALHTIAPRDHLQEVIAICRNRELGFARGQLVLHLSRFKNTEAVFQTLISLLGDESIRGQALEALWRYGDTRAIPAIEATPVREGFYEVQAKNTALRRLNRRNSGHAA